jgi:hypothetical protein
MPPRRDVAGDGKLAMLIILDRDFMGNAPHANPTNRDIAGGAGDGVLLLLMDLFLEILHPGERRGLGAEAHARGHRPVGGNGMRNRRGANPGARTGGLR